MNDYIDMNTMLTKACAFQRFVTENKNNDDCIYEKLTEIFSEAYSSQFFYQLKNLSLFDVADFLKNLSPDFVKHFYWTTKLEI